MNVQELLRKAELRQNVVHRGGGDPVSVPPDYVSRTNRLFSHMATLTSPFSRIAGVITQALILSIGGGRGE